MPIKIPADLPAREVLEGENIFVMTEHRAMTQDIRPLSVLLVNLMPTKIATETQIARLLGNSPLQVELELMHMGSHVSTHVPEEHLLSFYKTFDAYRERNFDGMIVTGAPVEDMDFEEVDYWDELTEVMDWSTTHVHSTFHICWGAQAALYHHYGIAKHALPERLHGVYEHNVRRKGTMLVRGADDVFLAPHSRNTGNATADIEACPELRVIASSEEAGVFAAMTDGGSRVFVTGHPEYDTETLGLEYERDLAAGKKVAIPVNYYPADDPSRPPVKRWRAHANLLFSNWLNYYVYQTTPYDFISTTQ